jgi:hypothetical protein
LTEIRTSGAQEDPRGDVSTVEIEKHRLVKEFMSKSSQTALVYVQLDGGEDGIPRLVEFHPSREIWAGQVWNMIVFHSAFSRMFRTNPLLLTIRHKQAFGFDLSTTTVGSSP